MLACECLKMPVCIPLLLTSYNCPFTIFSRTRKPFTKTHSGLHLRFLNTGFSEDLHFASRNQQSRQVKKVNFEFYNIKTIFYCKILAIRSSLLSKILFSGFGVLLLKGYLQVFWLKCLKLSHFRSFVRLKKLPIRSSVR